MNAKIIKDPVHGYIEMEDYALRLLDSPLLQRLRYVHQLGFSFLVYPGANHTRFEHSLGTMFLADVACRRFQLPEDEHRLVVSAALLHDIGHGPYSHASEPLMEEYLHRTHDEIRPVIDATTSNVLAEAGVDPEELARVVEGKHPLSSIIHGDFDVDRMDYLLRDAYYTGAPYGTVDAQRLIRHLIRYPDGTVLDENGINAAESLLIARTLMRPTVYYHHVSRIGESMFQLAALEHCAGMNAEERRQFLRLDDAGCMHSLRTSENPVPRGIALRLYERRLYKRAVYAGSDQINPVTWQDGITLEKSRDLAAQIAETAGIRAEEVLVDIPPIPREMSLGVRVQSRNAVTNFEELSPRIRTLNMTRREQWRLGIYSVPEHRDVVGDAACEVLHIRKPTRQDTLF
ncbi:HD domain-containing protein [Methanoregula sp.]|uniref:HD domain-containing protein n=1 Tax=Methanoregula sp. TaxID=2052170 RepID=UPI00261728FE|nr:HD domain-containing protein [Methanoregula sp.]MDD5142563.1 HD domain-containing protein [Methanoregula sp.]